MNKSTFIEKFEGYYVYRFFNAADEIIYVGKTTNLRERLRMHKWTKNNVNHYWFPEAERVEYIQVDSDYKMNILETHYISKCKPIYNVRLKYDFVDLFDLPHEEWKPYFSKNLWGKQVFALDILVPLIYECGKTKRGTKITKGKLLSLDSKLASICDTRRAELWSSPQVQQLIEDKIINIKGRTIEFL